MKKLIGLIGLIALVGMASSTYAQSGVALWSQRCGNCHTLQPPVWYTKLAWEAIMTHMAIYAHLTDDEAEAILEFLKGGAYRAENNESWRERMWARIRQKKPSQPEK